MAEQLDSFLHGSWRAGEGAPTPLVNPATEATIATVRAIQGSLADALRHGREVGGPALRAMSFAERGELLERIAKLVHEQREHLIDVAVANGGNTRGDAKFDIDGGIAVLAHYAELAKTMGREPWLALDEAEPIFRNSKIRAGHVLVPRHGLAIHINAFNFPAWGMLGKAAVSLLAGMPVLCKPATSTAHLAHRIVQLMVEREILPAGSFQLLMGSAGDLLDHVGPQDVIAFTGSQGVGIQIKTHPVVVARGTRVNLEADSLNAVVIGPDVEGELFDLVIRDLVVELTQKAGQKCTATRRVLVPESLFERVRDTLVERLADLKIGDPSDKAVRMGPLSSAAQLADARKGIELLLQDAELLRGDPRRSEGFVGVAPERGYFLEPVVLVAKPERVAAPDAAFHQHEVFGPVTTLLRYDGSITAAAQLLALGQGSLVGTVYADDREWLRSAIAELGPWLGRLVIASEKFAGASMSPGCVFPVANHGGPGRAGGGEELGGRFGLALYMQRVALQSGASQLAKLLEGK